MTTILTKLMNLRTFSPDEPAAPAPANSTDARNPDGSLKQNPEPGKTDPEVKPGETKPDDKAKTDDKGKSLANPDDKKPEDKKSVVPEKYEFKAPEGFEFDAAMVDKATPIFKELGLSQDGAQKLIDLWNENAIKAQEAPIEFYEKMRSDWRATAAKDPTLGDGKDNLSTATKENINKFMTAGGPAPNSGSPPKSGAQSMYPHLKSSQA
jgi:hypothetical protein